MHYWVSNEVTKPSFRQFDLRDGGNNAGNVGLIAALLRGVCSMFFFTCPLPSTLIPMPSSTMKVILIGKWQALTFISRHTLATRNGAFANRPVWFEFVQLTHIQT